MARNEKKEGKREREREGFKEKGTKGEMRLQTPEFRKITGTDGQTNQRNDGSTFF